MDMEQNYVTVILCMARSGSDGRREDERGEKRGEFVPEGTSWEK